MTPTTDTSDTDFEAEVRAMLTRRAGDVSPSPASGRHVTAVADRGLSPAPAARRTVRRTSRPARPLLVAALVVVVCGSALAVRSSVPGADDTTVTGEPDGEVTFPAPGTDGWDPATAPPVWPVVGEAALAQLPDDPHAEIGALATPERAAAAYLDDVSILLAPDPAGLVLSPDRRTAQIPWDGRDGGAGDPPVPTGSVFLRAVGEGTGALWVVVGAVTADANLEDVRVDDGTLGVTIALTPSPGTSVSVRVGIDGQFVPVRGELLPQGAAPELVRLSDDGRARVTVGVKPGEQADILVRLVGGDFLTVTHMAIEVPVPADPSTAAPSDPESGEPGADPGGQADDAAAPAGDPLPTPAGPLDGTGVLALDAGRGSAVEVAQAYLDDRLPERADGLGLDDGRSTQGTIPGGGAIVVIPWRIEPVEDAFGHVASDNPPLADRYSGEVQLRQIDGGWAVVAATTDQIALRDVRREGTSVTLTIDRLDDAAIDLIDLAVFDLDGNPVGEPTSAPLGVPGTYSIDLGAGVAPDAALTVRARHVGGTWFSLTELRVPPAGA
jgi:hypothetical protein